jgi:hypothetical protein
MTYVLVPGAFEDPEVNSWMPPTVWVGSINNDPGAARLTLDFELGQQELGPWTTWAAQDGFHRLDYQRLTLTGLVSRTTYTLRLLDDQGRQLADALITTLPDRLPLRGEGKPFTIFLGSCFFVGKDPGGTVGSSFLRIPTAVQPEVKFLCGDQVYLDAPWKHYAFTRHSVAELESELFEKYATTWGQTPRGFQDLLKRGVNYFSPDDHEYWNNAPDRAPLVRDSYWPVGNRRADWLRIARELFQAFQTPDAASSFTVGPLSFLNLDTRSDRRADQSIFITAESFRKVERWITGLRGPGVMVVGQPILASKTGVKGHLVDWGLPDYTQYGDLIRLIAGTRHTIVILTGDVHFGRIATCTLASGAQIIEVISSPMALVDDAVGHQWGEPPKSFPDFDVPLVVRSRQIQVRDFKYSENHFMTLEFLLDGATVVMTVKAWPVIGGWPALNPVFTAEINLGIGVTP